MTPHLSGVIIRDLQKALSQARALVTDIASQFARDHATFERADDGDLYTIPRALTDSIMAAAKNVRTASALPKMLVEKLAYNAGAGEKKGLIIDPSELTASLTSSVIRLPAEPSALWLQTIDRKFRIEAVNAFDRVTVATSEISTSIRLSALLLAGELIETARRRTRQDPEYDRSKSQMETAMLFYNIAAGITWLERRNDGTDPATEKIMLAIE
jgi:hypothetical protein